MLDENIEGGDILRSNGRDFIAWRGRGESLFVFAVSWRGGHSWGIVDDDGRGGSGAESRRNRRSQIVG